MSSDERQRWKADWNSRTQEWLVDRDRGRMLFAASSLAHVMDILAGISKPLWTCEETN